MTNENRIGVEVTFAAILAAQECGDFGAIKAAEKGGNSWDAYIADYIGRHIFQDFTRSPLTNVQSADLRRKVLEQAALLPHKLYWVNSASGLRSVPLGEYANKREAEAAVSASDTELMQWCDNNDACRVEVLTGYWEAKCIVMRQHRTR